MQLSDLPPLPKVHGWWPVKTETLEKCLSRGCLDLRELVRLTGLACLDAEYCTQRHVTWAVDTCRWADVKEPGVIKRKIQYQLSPYHHAWNKKADPWDEGTAYKKEIELYARRMDFCRDALDNANVACETDVEVATVFIDCEVFTVASYAKGSETWGNEFSTRWENAIFAKYHELYDIAHRVFPNARIQFHGYGTSNWRFTHEGRERVILQEGGFDAELYALSSNPRLMYDRMTMLAKRTKEYKAKIVTPWIGLGVAYPYAQGDDPDNHQHDYALHLSWLLGNRLHDPHAGYPWNAATGAMFYPAPFQYPNFKDHLVAYACGAHGVGMGG